MTVLKELASGTKENNRSHEPRFGPVWYLGVSCRLLPVRVCIEPRFCFIFSSNKKTDTFDEGKFGMTPVFVTRFICDVGLPVPNLVFFFLI